MANRYLPIYLNDHLVALVAAGQLARRVQGSNAGEELGAYAERLAGELDDELAALRDVMRRAGVREDPLKRVAGLVGERLGRLKLNGHLRTYSPLSRLLEVEALLLMATGSEALWRSLGDAEWAARAAARRDALETHRAAAAERALGQMSDSGASADVPKPA